MKTTHAILAALFASLLVSAFSFAGEPEVERRMEIKISADGELVELDANDMEVGDTRQTFTDSGKEVLVTRTDEGFQLEIDGKEINVDVPHDEHHTMLNMTSGNDRKVIIRKFDGDGDKHGYHFIHGGEGDHHWVEKDGDDVDIVIERYSAADRLLESGVLDDLDEAKRQEILDALRDQESAHEIHKKVKVMIQEEIHEEHDEDQ